MKIYFVIWSVLALRYLRIVCVTLVVGSDSQIKQNAIIIQRLDSILKAVK